MVRSRLRLRRIAESWAPWKPSYQARVISCSSGSSERPGGTTRGPEGTVVVQHDGETYSYYLGTFYVNAGDQYQVVTAPVGATVTMAIKP